MTYADNCCIDEGDGSSYIKNQTEVFWSICFKADRSIKATRLDIRVYFQDIDATYPVPAVAFAVMKSWKTLLTHSKSQNPGQ